jgi:DNA-binding NarL/FixJ family response regulator
MRISNDAVDRFSVPDFIEQHLYYQRALRMSLAASSTRLSQTSAQIVQAAGPLWCQTASPGFPSPPLRTTLPAPVKQAPPELELLTAREIAVLKLIAEGFSSKEIAHQLGITFKTACCHRFNLMQKLNVREVATLVRIAVRSGLVRP